MCCTGMQLLRVLFIQARVCYCAVPWSLCYFYMCIPICRGTWTKFRLASPVPSHTHSAFSMCLL